MFLVGWHCLTATKHMQHKKQIVNWHTICVVMFELKTVDSNDGSTGKQKIVSQGGRT